MLVLGIESSCDDTGISLYDDKIGILINQLYVQKCHSKYGGVVPELASRSHMRVIVPLIKKIIRYTKLYKLNINGLAYTAGPGLSGSLIVGASICNSLGYAMKIPVIAVNHMEGHIMSYALSNKENVTFPFVSLLISGGHTQLVYATTFGKYRILGESIDDSVGEAFDKVAKLLGFKYPGGVMLSKVAKKGISKKYYFPRPLINKQEMNFSFSGLKTFVTKIVSSTNIKDFQIKANIARAFEDSVADIIVNKCKYALNFTGINKLVVSGGVSSNMYLRKCISNMIKERKGELFFSDPKFCTDNGAMIAYVGCMRLKLSLVNKNFSFLIKPKWRLDDL